MPDMGGKTWAVRIGGSDTLLAMPSREDADWWCFVWGQVLDVPGDSLTPQMAPEVVEWPYSAEAHARNLAKQEADMEALR